MDESFLLRAVGAKLNLSGSGQDEDNRFGIKFGLSYNTLIGVGFGGGVDYRVSKTPIVLLGGGLMFYPDARDKLLIRINEDEGRHYTDFNAPLASVQPFVSLSILFGK